MPLPSLEQESDLPMSVSPNHAPHTNSHKIITDDVLVFSNLPTILNDSFEFEVGEDLVNPSELDMSVKSDIEYYEIAQLGETIL